jgi:hypothetical protein
MHNLAADAASSARGNVAAEVPLPSIPVPAPAVAVATPMLSAVASSVVVVGGQELLMSGIHDGSVFDEENLPPPQPNYSSPQQVKSACRNSRAACADLDHFSSRDHGRPKFDTTHVVIDGRGCLIGRGDEGFDANTFHSALLEVLKNLGAGAVRVRVSACLRCRCLSVVGVEIVCFCCLKNTCPPTNSLSICEQNAPAFFLFALLRNNPFRPTWRSSECSTLITGSIRAGPSSMRSMWFK